jgi:ligand-binding sensor domain-containing protein/signal transduction histidine kinase
MVSILSKVNQTMTTADRPGRHVIARSAVIAYLILACFSCAFALNPSLDVSQYAHTAWKIRDGFFKGSISSIVQTPDGYLWLGTETGLLRFDGVRNLSWQPPAGQHLPSNAIMSLLVARDGTLWIGTQKGLASWKDGALTQHTELAGQYVFKLVEDREGSVWASGFFPIGKLCEYQKNSVRCYGDDGSLGRGAFNLFEDSKGNLWAGVRDGIWRWKSGPPKFYPLPGEPNGIQALAEDIDGSLLVGWKGGLHRFNNGKAEAYRFSNAVGKFDARRLLRDRDGGLWIGTPQGILHVHNGRTDVFGASDGLSGALVYSMFEDREGSIWVATADGLDRFRDYAVVTFSPKQGLLNVVVGSVLAARDGSVWLGTYAGLNRWINGEITIPQVGSGPRNGQIDGLPPSSLFQDNSGRVWITTLGKVGYLDGDRFITVSGLPGGVVTSIAQDTANSLWISDEHSALFELKQGSVVQQIPWTTFGQRGHGSALAADSSQGGLWIGFALGGVSYFAGNQVRASYTAADGLGDGRVNDLRMDQDGILWAGTEGGLSLLKNGRVATLGARNGLPCDTVQWTMEDNSRSVWIYTACGLVRIARPDLESWIASANPNGNTTQTIQFTVFDSSDGVRSHANASHYSPQVAKTSDGKLWFLPWDGVSVIDSLHLPFNTIAPPVHVEQIIADRKTYDTPSHSNEGLRLPPTIRDLQIDYTALSLVAPEKIRFRYKLEGYDRDWQDAGNRREAFYTNLPPRQYRFRVIACNNSGVWNEAGAFLDFSIAPAYYQTSWFRVLFALAIALALIAINQLRVRQVARRVRAGMEGRLDERERIARDLHDTLLQSVQGLILKVHAAAKQITVDVAARDALEKTLDHADQVLAEGRDRVRNLRATAVSLDNLPEAFKCVAEETPQASKMGFKTVVQGSERDLHPLVREESYCIGREAITNALTHSGGRQVEVEIIYEQRQFRLRVRDDGHGIDQKILEQGGRSDHWGMKGMRERANKIGAELKLWSGHATGTEVELTVPGATAYQGNRESNRSWSAFFQKLFKQ